MKTWLASRAPSTTTSGGAFDEGDRDVLAYDDAEMVQLGCTGGNHGEAFLASRLRRRRNYAPYIESYSRRLQDALRDAQES